MNFNKKNITILCKVIDNYGDIGVVYRLAKSLTEQNPSLNLTIVCSSLKSFSQMASDVDPDKKIQTIDFKGAKWTITDWDLSDDDVAELKTAALPVSDFSFPVILECFQCGRPDWIENVIFSPENKAYHYIFNIEYLTAEQYADDFHLLKCYTRSTFVKKRFFMPGFTDKTAGLIVDNDFLEKIPAAVSGKSEVAVSAKNQFIVTLFSYERDFTQIFQSLNAFQEKVKKTNPNFSVLVKAAAGKSLPYAKAGWEKTGKIVQFEELPFLQQQNWDKILCTSNLNFIRGEESLARAALTGIPFVWHAYLQDEDYQLVKVDALLDRLEPFINPPFRQNLRRLWDDYNTPDKKLNEEDLMQLFEQTYSGQLCKDFIQFSRYLLSNGNLAKNLLEYIEKTVPENGIS